MAKDPTDSEVLEGAERRAAISTFLAQNPGEHKPVDIGKNLGMRANVAGRVLQEMASNGVIPKPRVEKGIKFYRDSNTPAPEGTKRKYTRRTSTTTHEGLQKIAKGKDVELVVGGTMIVIGRNSSTGRLRITLEDVA